MKDKIRESGILLPIFSLPSKYGIGSFGIDAYHFIDFLKESNIRYWQILPIGPTSYGDSPYQALSSYAGNPYFIDLDLLIEDGLLTNEDVLNDISYSLHIDYEYLFNTRYITLRKAFNRFDKNLLKQFENDNSYWLDDYSLFMTIKSLNNNKSFLEWDDDLKLRNIDSLEKIKEEHYDDIMFWKFIQYEFYKQYFNLKSYANKNEISIIGDMPIYVSLDSSDVWSNKDEFLLDERYNPTLVAGVPPDYFSKTGQLWGNPLYDYKHMKDNGYDWWIKRFKFNNSLYDVTRIDHFRGFESFYSIPYKDVDATNGHWIKGPDFDLFETVEDKIGRLNIIAENLGLITDEVNELLKKTNYPGMKVLQFGFVPNKESDASFFNLEYNCVLYTGTHDNETTVGWYQNLTDDTKKYIHDQLFFESPFDACNSIIRLCLGSVCRLAIIPFGDYLQKGNDCRINTPSTLGGNWCFRIEYGDLNKDLASYIKHLQLLYYRNQE